MLDFKLPIELPVIDLNTLLPLLALIVLATLILLALLARSILRSRLVLVVIVVLVLMGGLPQIGGAITGSLGALTTLLVASGALMLGGLFLIGRNPELQSLVRELISRSRSTPADLSTSNARYEIIEPDQLPRLPATGQPPRRSAVKSKPRSLPKDWGF
jgi:hypothetical protein